MTDLLLLLDGAESLVDGSAARRLLAKSKGSLVFVAPPPLEGSHLDANRLLNWHWCQGVDTTATDDSFVLRDIVLVEHVDTKALWSFMLGYVWCHPESTFDIDAVRTPHEGPTDPRNNPLGKNPGNVWQFGSELTGRLAKSQSRLFENGERRVECLPKSKIAVAAIERFILCHSAAGDTVHFHAAKQDAEKLKAMAGRLGRKTRPLAPGEPDPLAATTIERVACPVGETTPSGPTWYEGHDATGTKVRLGYTIEDCRAAIAHLPPGSISSVVTSPPYNIGYSPFNVPKPDPVTGELRAPARRGYDDALPPAVYVDLIASTMEAIDTRLDTTQADVFWNVKNSYTGGECAPPFWMASVAPKRWRLADIMIWRYDISYDPAVSKYKPYYEWVFHFVIGKAEARPVRLLQDYYIPILKGNSKERLQLTHPAIFPRQLVHACLARVASKGLVFDPFLGSGTTLAGAFGVGRNAFGSELNPAFEKDILHRIRELGLRPSKVDTVKARTTSRRK
jgi:hypothetical protein